MKINTREIAMLSLLLALSLIFSRILVFEYPPGQTAVKISVSFVLGLTGIWFGPKKGFIFALLSDTIGFFMLGQSTGVYYFGFTINAILLGTLPGFIYLGFKNTKLKDIDFTYPIVIVLLILLTVVSLNYESILGGFSSTDGRIYFTEFQSMLFFSLQVLSIISMIIFVIYSKYKFKSKGLYSMDKVIIAVLPGKALVSFILTPIWLSNMYGSSFVLFLPIRYLLFPASTISSIIVLYIVLKRFSDHVETIK